MRMTIRMSSYLAFRLVTPLMAKDRSWDDEGPDPIAKDKKLIFILLKVEGQIQSILLFNRFSRYSKLDSYKTNLNAYMVTLVDGKIFVHSIRRGVTLGISTMLTYVPASLGTTHQAGALTLLTLMLLLTHTVRKPSPGLLRTLPAIAKAHDSSIVLVYEDSQRARHNGQNYVFALLTGCRDPPAVVRISEGLHYNPYFPGGAIAKPKMLNDGAVEYEDGSPATEAQMGKDIVSFLSWAVETEMEERKLGDVHRNEIAQEIDKDNIYGDPEAADVVFTSGAETTQMKFKDDDLDELRRSKGKNA